MHMPIARILITVVFSVLPSWAQTPSKADAEKKSDQTEAKKPETPPEKPFADLIKDAKAIKGLFTSTRRKKRYFWRFSRISLTRCTCCR
jgi:hypothetical protein